MWQNPLPLVLMPVFMSESFREIPAWATGVPVGDHPGAFGVVRRFHVHEGVDLYCPAGTRVRAVEAGRVIAVKWFTGPSVGLDHWHDTMAVFVEGESGVVVYGEIMPGVMVGQWLSAGDEVGYVVQVLRRDKGRPMAMLHLELRVRGDVSEALWYQESGRPLGLLDPTPYLLQIVWQLPTVARSIRSV